MVELLDTISQGLLAFLVWYTGRKIDTSVTNVSQALKINGEQATGKEIFDRLTALEGTSQLNQQSLEGLESRVKRMGGRLSHHAAGNGEPQQLSAILPIVLQQMAAAQQQQQQQQQQPEPHGIAQNSF